MPPALSEISITGGPPAAWNARDHRAAIARRAVEALKPIAGFAQVRLHEIEQRRPLREHERLVAVGGRRLERLHERAPSSTTSPPAGPGTSAGWHAAWRSRSSASSAASTLPPSREQRHHLLARRRAHGVVDGALASSSSTYSTRLGARRQLGRDLALEAAQHEGPDASCAAARPRRASPFGDRRARSAPRSRARPPSRPRLVKCSRLQSSSSRFSTGVPLSATPERAVQRVGGARHLAVGVLDGLRLVEDHRVPARARAPPRRGAAARTW